ncbi:MAG: polysaccharide lyase family 7 protein [Bacteroidota bacterium]
MNIKHTIKYVNISVIALLFFALPISLLLNSCSNIVETSEQAATYPSDVLSLFDHYNLILGDGSNAGIPIDFKNEDFFYTATDEAGNWVVYKTPNAGNTHGTSNNTRTELAQLKKWSPMTEAEMTATCKVMNVSPTGDARVAASYSVVIGQIHSADGHENEPLKIFYKKFPGHKKGSVFWNYEINTAGDDNSKRWDYSYPVWGYDFSVVGKTSDTYPAEPEDGIELGEAMTYEIEVKDGMMYLTFKSDGHKSKTFAKNLIESEYTKVSDIPKQVQKLFVPIGQDGVERPNAYAEEGLFFKKGCYNQTNGKDPAVNKIWCSGAETHDGDIPAQYADGNYAEVWFKEASVSVPEDAISNAGYFAANDGLSKKVVHPHEVIPFMDKFKILLGDGTKADDLTQFQHEDFFYTTIDGTRRWVVYKTPNSGVTSKNSSNTRTELHEKREWTPEEGGRLTGTCKVIHVSTSGDARVAASYATVVGQIHSGEGHENEPLKIFYKKFPGHEKGSVFWNYEINTAGDDNSGRWDYSHAIWGYDMSIVGESPTDFPTEPEDGIELGETFSYEINVHEGIMYLTFESEGHETKTFTKNLIQSEYTTKADIPAQTQQLFVPIGQDGVERPEAYAGELNYFKQGAYNQTNGKDPKTNMVWCTGAETYGGDIQKQYANGDYTEVWFLEASIGESVSLEK